MFKKQTQEQIPRAAHIVRIEYSRQKKKKKKKKKNNNNNNNNINNDKNSNNNNNNPVFSWGRGALS